MLIARWQIDARFGHKQEVIDSIVRGSREIAPQVGLHNGRLCTEWKEAPKKPCQIFDKEGDVLKSIDSETGQVRITILKTAPGNAEKLMPN